MAHRHLLFRTEAREKLLHGASALADAIRLTIGPKAKCVLIQKKWGKPIVCDDGVTIAKEFDLKDSEENLGAKSSVRRLKRPAMPLAMERAPLLPGLCNLQRGAA